MSENNCILVRNALSTSSSMDRGLAGTAAQRFFWTGARTRGIVVCLFLQIAVLKFSGMHKNFSWSVHYMVQFSIPAETTIIIGYSGMREPNPGWWQQEKNRVNSRKFKPAGRPFAQRSLACFFLICKPSHNFVFCCELVYVCYVL